jgi:hypothetical protein
MKPFCRVPVLCLAVLCLLAVLAAPAPAHPPITFQTLTWAPYWSPQSREAVTGQPHSFKFVVFYPSASAVVTDGEIVIETETGDSVMTVPVTGIDHYVIEDIDDANWNRPVINSFAWSKCGLAPGNYEWHALVTIKGAQNHNFDTGSLHVSLFTINDAVGFTRNPTVTVAYFPPAGTSFFQIASSESAWPATWQAIPDSDRTVSWDLPSSRDGGKPLFMRFAENPDGTGVVQTADGCINLDTHGPVTRAPQPASVSRGHYVRLKYGAKDSLSAAGMFTIKIRNRSEDVVKVLNCGTQQLYSPQPREHTKGFVCDLPRGIYRFYVYASDQAGNEQANVASNKLVVR